MKRFELLRGALTTAGVEHAYLAELLGFSRCHISHCFNLKAQWTLGDQYKILDIINQPPETLHKYFPRDGVDNEIHEYRKKMGAL